MEVILLSQIFIYNLVFKKLLKQLEGRVWKRRHDISSLFDSDNAEEHKDEERSNYVTIHLLA